MRFCLLWLKISFNVLKNGSFFEGVDPFSRSNIMFNPVVESGVEFSETEMPPSFFAPAGRQEPQDLEKLSSFTLEDPIVATVLETVGTFVLVLNQNRQILAANREVLDALRRDEQGPLLGMRPGEAFGCVSATTGPDGCGTSRNCHYCGAVMALLQAQERKEPCASECMMTILEDDKPVGAEFYIRAVPIKLKGQWLTIMVLRDISSEKRRHALERIFLHDFNNILTGLVGLSELAASRPEAGTFEQLSGVIRLLSREMSGQRLLLEAERGDLNVDLSEVRVSEIFREIEDLFSIRMLHLGRPISIELRGDDALLWTDRRLVVRVLTNMVKNAVEATTRGSQVRLWFETEGQLPCFRTWNKEPIDHDTAARIFKRSFSTKGELGRGLGTYSMKLLGEYYLKGSVNFSTSKESGTVFHFSLPREAFLS